MLQQRHVTMNMGPDMNLYALRKELKKVIETTKAILNEHEVSCETKIFSHGNL